MIIPAFNAAGTLGKAIGSVAAQAGAPWDIIVVDDGSTDATAEVARKWSARDDRIRVVRQHNAGVAAARNAGLAAARRDWVCFLDADDWLASDAFKRLLDLARRSPNASVLVGRTLRLSEGGRRWPYAKRDLSDPFSVFCFDGAIPIHSAIVRRVAVIEVGGFDEQLRTSEDWDLWQRIARAGHQFAQTDAVVSFYQGRPGSLSRDVPQAAADGLEVMRRGHAPDPRLSYALPAYSGGGPADALPVHQLYFILWSAARDIAIGGDGLAVAALLAKDADVDFEPDAVGELMAAGMADILACRPEELGVRWPELGPKLTRLLDIVYPENSRERVKALALAVIKARVNCRRAADPEVIQLNSPSLSKLVDGGADFAVLQLRAGPSTLGAVAIPRLGNLGGATIAEAVAEQARRLPLGTALRALRPWRTLAFWTAVAPCLNLRGLSLLRQRRNLHGLQQVLRHRLRHAVATGLHAAVRAKLSPLRSGAAGCAHAEELARLRADAARLSTPDLSALRARADTGEGGRRPDTPDRAEAWDAFFETDDPWNYGASDYERVKYQDTLELIPELREGSGLELACAEGHFTARLAARVGRLLATDISARALAKAAQRCGHLSNVSFRKLDFIKQPVPGRHDLIVCSEVLYYAGNQLTEVANKLAAALTPGGLLVMAHANQIADEPETTGFDWGHNFGSRTIGDVFSSVPGLELEREIRRPLYRVQAFRKEGGRESAQPAGIEERPLQIRLEHHVARHVVWGGGQSRLAALSREVATSLPILMYHRVAPAGGPTSLNRYRVDPEVFAEQMAYLRQHAYWGVTPDRLSEALRGNRPLPGRPVMITFDDGYADFAEHAWPVLQRHDLAATVFVVPGKVGTYADWDAAHGPPAPLLGWDSIAALSRDGLAVESHGLTHRRLTRLSVREVYREVLSAQALIEKVTKRAPISICYPFGAHDRVIERAAQECGCQIGFSATIGMATLASHPLRLPRLEVSGSDDLQSFIRKVARS